ncbi:hypothetical protein BST40_27960, partial [Mycobacterium persicum]
MLSGSAVGAAKAIRPVATISAGKRGGAGATRAAGSRRTTGPGGPGLAAVSSRTVAARTSYQSALAAAAAQPSGTAVAAVTAGATVAAGTAIAAGSLTATESVVARGGAAVPADPTGAPG